MEKQHERAAVAMVLGFMYEQGDAIRGTKTGRIDVWSPVIARDAAVLVWSVEPSDTHLLPLMLCKIEKRSNAHTRTYK